MFWRKKPKTLKVFEPVDPHEAAQGWALHATRRRIVHEDESRVINRRRYIVGAVSVSLAAVVGTSAFAGWQSHTKSTTFAIVTAVLGIGAAVLSSATTYLDYGGRAEAHRRAATAYKNVLREFERISAVTPKDKRFDNPEHLETLKKRLTDADDAAPTVPKRRGAEVDGREFYFEDEADYLNPMDRPQKVDPLIPKIMPPGERAPHRS